jgi:hypothetical protein
MKKMINSLKKLFLIAIISLIAVSAAFADDPEPPNPGGDPTNNGGNPVGAPIDGGLSILLLLGAGYGGLKLYKNNKAVGDGSIHEDELGQ